MMDAIDFLLKEHNQIRKYLVSIANAATEKTKEKRFLVLSKFLERHEKMEQTVWYPYLKKNTKLAAVIKKLITEEKTAAKNLKKTKKLKTTEAFDKHVAAISKAVKKHAGDEETKLFPKADKALEKAELVELGRKMRKFKAAHAI